MDAVEKTPDQVKKSVFGFQPAVATLREVADWLSQLFPEGGIEELEFEWTPDGWVVVVGGTARQLPEAG